MASKRTTALPGKRRRRPGGSPWPAMLVLGGIALLAVALYAAYQAGGSAPGAKGPGVSVEVSGRPAVKSDQQLIDLGYARLNKPVQASFQIQNVGDQPLRITAAPYIEVLEGC